MILSLLPKYSGTLATIYVNMHGVPTESSDNFLEVRGSVSVKAAVDYFMNDITVEKYSDEQVDKLIMLLDQISKLHITWRKQSHSMSGGGQWRNRVYDAWERDASIEENYQRVTAAATKLLQEYADEYELRFESGVGRFG